MFLENFCQKLLLTLFSLGAGSLSSQSVDDILQNKYWNYRNRELKYFINYQNPGHGGYGTPCYQHNIGKYGLAPVRRQRSRVI